MENSLKVLILLTFLPIFLCGKPVQILRTNCGQLGGNSSTATVFCRKLEKMWKLPFFDFSTKPCGKRKLARVFLQSDDFVSLSLSICRLLHSCWLLKKANKINALRIFVPRLSTCFSTGFEHCGKTVEIFKSFPQIHNLLITWRHVCVKVGWC